MKTSNDVINAALKATGMSKVAAGRSVGWNAQQIGQRMTRGTMQADDFLRLMDGMGVDVTYTVRDTGFVIPDEHKQGPDVKGMSDRVIYDTRKSFALANDFYTDDSESMYNEDGVATELYVDNEGRYFFAMYYEDDPKRNCVKATSAAVAKSFIKAYSK